MSKVYDALMKAQREGGETGVARSLRDRMRHWIRRHAPEALTTPAAEPQALDAPRAPELTPPVQGVDRLREEIASLHVAVDSLDDRLSAEVVEREAKLLEEIRRGMRALEVEVSDRFVAASLEMQRTVRRGTALVVVFVGLLAGVVVGALALL